MKLNTWTRRLVWSLGICAGLYLLALAVIGPPMLARKHPFTWEQRFQQNVELLAARKPSEEEFIKALQRKGFKIRMPTKKPLTFTSNGGRKISFYEHDGNYTTYGEFLHAFDRHQNELPKNYVVTPRNAQITYGFVVCGREFQISWHLFDGKIVEIKALDIWSCV